MSAAEKHPDETREQFVTRPTADVLIRLELQRNELGFLTANALAGVILSEFSGVPPAKVWEAIAKVRAYHRREPITAKPRRGGKRP
jgi:hypothetical protein